MSTAKTVKQAITSWTDGRVLFECEVPAVEANLIVDQMIALAKLRGWKVE